MATTFDLRHQLGELGRPGLRIPPRFLASFWASEAERKGSPLVIERLGEGVDLTIIYLATERNAGPARDIAREVLAAQVGARATIARFSTAGYIIRHLEEIGYPVSGKPVGVASWTSASGCAPAVSGKPFRS